MMNVIRRACFCGVLASLAFAGVRANAQDEPTALDRQLARVDLAVSGVGVLTTNTSGTTYLPQLVSLKPSTTLGALVTLRYTRSPFVGAELNYSYARYTDNYTVTNTAASPTNASSFVLGVQANHSEYTLGYVAHTKQRFGVQPFVSGGGGFLAFRPTNGGGQGVTTLARPAFYYSVGAEDLVYGQHFGLRASFRQVFFTAPDYKQNYLNNNQRSITTEPSFGFFLRF